MDNLRETLDRVIAGYGGKAANGSIYPVRNEKEDVWAVISVGRWRDEHIANAGLIVRLINDKIIIELDLNSKPLYEALVQAGIPRQQIVLAYAGEATDSVHEMMKK